MKDQALAIINSLPLAQSFHLGSVEQDAINSAYLSVFRILILMTIVTTALAFLAILCMQDIRLSNDKVEAEPVPDSVERDLQDSEKGKGQSLEKV